MLIQQTAKSLQVAVLGSGVAGSSAARSLAERGIKVTVFEAGFGIGGRTSTRKTRDEFRYQFDHGAQYIGTPKTEQFQNTLRQWRSDGWVKEWSGSFLTAGERCEMTKQDDTKERYVGYPAMNSICRNLLHHENIRVKLQTRANASRGKQQWSLVDDKSKKDLGSFDWLISADRLSGDHYRRDLKDADIHDFTSDVRKIKNVKSLTAMVVFEKSLGLDIDGVDFTGDCVEYGSLGWAARDSSKPGRERDDGKECWVLQSNPSKAKELLKGKRKIGEIREMAKEVLVKDFLASIPHLSGDGDGNDPESSTAVPEVAMAMGHRWGAAFPIPTKKYTDMESQLISSENFAACGDYFGALPGRIEGAFLSGVSAADQLVDTIQQDDS